MCAIIRKPDDIHAELAAVLDVLLRDVGFRRVGRDAHRRGAGGMRGIEILDGADARQQQHRDPRARHARDGRLDPFAIGVRAEAVVEARAREPVTVADLDGIDAGAIERRGDAPHVGDGILVADGVHAVAQRDVLDVEARAALMPSPAAPPSDAASRSPVRSAADVMMSRLPAYFGR